MENNIKKLILSVLFGLFIAILTYSSILSYPIFCTENDFILNISDHSSASIVGENLEDNICIDSRLFKLAIYITFNQKNIKPGLYSMKGIRSVRDLLKLITSISKNRISLTIYEGWNINDIANSLERILHIDKNKFIDLCFNKSFIKSIGIDYDIPSLEGFLFPDTYVMLSTYSEKDVIRILTRRFMDIYNNNINMESIANNLSVTEIITLASIIQGEAMVKDEMPLISSVYHYRMMISKELEADPTILYYMTNEDLLTFKKSPGTKESSKVFRKYKNIDNPYNTYKNKGLPLGPINNPGLESLKAASNPTHINKKYLYFVADGTGRHIFSHTFKDHKKAIRKIKNGY